NGRAGHAAENTLRGPDPRPEVVPGHRPPDWRTRGSAHGGPNYPPRRVDGMVRPARGDPPGSSKPFGKRPDRLEGGPLGQPARIPRPSVAAPDSIRARNRCDPQPLVRHT